MHKCQMVVTDKLHVYRSIEFKLKLNKDLNKNFVENTKARMMLNIEVII